VQQAVDGRSGLSGSGRVALITGAASGIGRATAERLARADWAVYATFRPQGRSAPPRGQGADARIRWLPLDVSDESARRAALRVIESAHGRLDVLVNNAGVLATGPLEEIRERALREVMEVNFFGALNVTRTFLPMMRRQSGGGIILMISSLSGLIGLPFEGAYAASKFALEGASESLRYELEPFGIRVALIEPGAYATALTNFERPPHGTASAYPAYEQPHSARAARISRDADPAEVAALIEDTIARGAPQLHVPCGAQAHAIVARLRTLSESERREFALRAADLSVTP
jgi:NAD(P)-dependent dehydrogenase (short-subunit alcohol dehydrogenase family)